MSNSTLASALRAAAVVTESHERAAQIVLAEARRRCLGDEDPARCAEAMFRADASVSEQLRAAAAAAGVEAWQLVEWCRESAAIRAGVRKGEVRP